MTTSAVVGRVAVAIIAFVPIFAGYLHRSPWIILPLGAVFSVLHILGRLEQWWEHWRVIGPPMLWSLALTVPIQCVLVAVLYLIGFGVGSLIDDRPRAAALTNFDSAIAIAVLVLGSALTLVIRVIETPQRLNRSEGNVLSQEIQTLIGDVITLEAQTTAMPVQIFSLARRFAEHGDRDETFAVLEPMAFDSESAFVRRVAMTALRFMGQAGRDYLPTDVDRRIIAGMQDPAVWVRYDAAWAAGEIEGEGDAFATALRDMIARAEADPGNTRDTESAAALALKRARASLAAIEARQQARPVDPR